MRLRGAPLQDVLADTWDRWSRRCADLDDTEWSTPTRCHPWDVRALTAHVCPDPAMFDRIPSVTRDGPPAAADAAEVLRLFNRPDGVAYTMADQIAGQAISESESLQPAEAVARFAECARVLRTHRLDPATVIEYPVVGTVTLDVVAELALMEATVHLADLVDAAGGIGPSAEALAAVRDLMVAVPDPADMVEVLAGRRPAEIAVPAVR